MYDYKGVLQFPTFQLTLIWMNLLLLLQLEDHHVHHHLHSIDLNFINILSCFNIETFYGNSSICSGIIS
jgi:hypothetical protein